MLTLGKTFDPATKLRVVDAVAVLLAASLPWSTSATAILSVLWLLAVLPTLRRSDRGILHIPAGALPVLLVLLGIIGMLWADVTLIERWHGLDSFLKLLFIPILFAHFRRSEHGVHVFAGYLLSCVALLVVSYGVSVLHVQLTQDPGVPVKNAASQSGEFATCIMGLLYLAQQWAQKRRWLWGGAALVIILAMAADMVFIATGRTALVVILVLLPVFALMYLRPREVLILTLGALLLAIVAWFSSHYLRARTEQIWTDLQAYEATDVRNSSGERMEFAKRSLEFIREAPLIGHGTGTIHELFIKAAAQHTGAAGVAAANPHNQTLAVGIQLGAIGIVVLWAMWLVHLLWFRGPGLINWVGLVLVVQNIVGSLFNSHLFDFLQGWTYVIGVGIAGGMILREKAKQGAPEI